MSLRKSLSSLYNIEGVGIDILASGIILCGIPILGGTVERPFPDNGLIWTTAPVQRPFPDNGLCCTTAFSGQRPFRITAI
jgi:hypothetical protein